MIQSRTPFLEALIMTVVEYWTDQNVWATPRESAIVRYVEGCLGSLHGRDKIRNVLNELVDTGILTRTQHGPYEITFALNPHYMWPNDAGYLEPWRTVLIEPKLYVDEQATCWAYGEPAVRGGPRLIRLPVYPHHFQQFLVCRARYHCRVADLNPDHPEVELIIKRAMGEAALETARALHGRTRPWSPARVDLDGQISVTPIVNTNPDLRAWRRQHRGKNRRRWRPEDDPLSYIEEIELVLARLCGALEPPRQRAPFKPGHVFSELDAQLRGRLAHMLKETPPKDAGISDAERAEKVPVWVVRACAGRSHRNRPTRPRGASTRSPVRESGG